MNLTHLRYVVEVERLGSITKAASALYMGQPNLSKAIKEMEHEVGVPIFKRSAKGVVPTDKGKEFLQYAKAILVQMDKMEQLYKDNDGDRVSFSLLLPRASYVSHAFTAFLNKVGGRQYMDIKIKETNSMDAINAVVECEYDLGLIRYPIAYESFFLPVLEEKNLAVLSSWAYDYVLIMSAESALAKVDNITEETLEKYIEILHGDNTVPNISSVYQRRNARINDHRRHIYVYERGSQFDILSACPDSYMWVSPMPKEILDRCGLVQRKCSDVKRTNKDVLISQSSYRPSATDQLFIDELERVRMEIGNGIEKVED